MQDRDPVEPSEFLRADVMRGGANRPRAFRRGGGAVFGRGRGRGRGMENISAAAVDEASACVINGVEVRC
jgi:hypothetical protein